jgi:hypothetical protein
MAGMADQKVQIESRFTRTSLTSIVKKEAEWNNGQITLYFLIVKVRRKAKFRQKQGLA